MLKNHGSVGYGGLYGLYSGAVLKPGAAQGAAKNLETGLNIKNDCGITTYTTSGGGIGAMLFAGIKKMQGF